MAGALLCTHIGNTGRTSRSEQVRTGSSLGYKILIQEKMSDAAELCCSLQIAEKLYVEFWGKNTFVPMWY